MRWEGPQLAHNHQLLSLVDCGSGLSPDPVQGAAGPQGGHRCCGERGSSPRLPTVKVPIRGTRRARVGEERGSCVCQDRKGATALMFIILFI